MIRFGDGSQMRDVELKDVAGRDINKTYNTYNYNYPTSAHLTPLDKLNQHLRRVPADFVHHMRNSEELTTEQADRRYVELLVRERIEQVDRRIRPAEGPREGPLSDFIEPSSTRLLLVGEGGAGKTTLLLKLEDDAALRALQDPKEPIPIYVRLNFFNTKEDGFDRLIEMVGNAAGLGEQEMKGMWRNAERRCLFLLDGFNEVARDFEQACISALQEFMQSKPHRYIITSRPTIQSQKLAKQVRGIKVMDIVPLNDVQIESFLERHGAAELYEQMGKQLKGLVRNPFMLWALVQSCARLPKAKLPTNKGQLYQGFVDRYIFEEREQEKVPPPTEYNYPLVKKPILAKQALMMSKEKITRCQANRKLLKLWREWLKECRAENEGLVELKPYELMPDPPAAKALLDEAVHNGVLRRVKNSLEFMHESVQDYFTALQLNSLGFDNPEVRRCLDDIAQDKTDDSWDETMILLAGLTSDLDKLVEALLPRDPFLASLCAGVRPNVLKSQVAVLLIETLASTSVETLANSTENVYSPWWQKVITAYEQAWPLAQKDSLKLKWAHLQQNLGVAYANLPTGDRAANKGRAIECYAKALHVFTPERCSDKYAATQHHLGNAYCDLPTGNRRENLTQAVKCYEEALRFRTPDGTPLEYAVTLSNLSNAYRHLQTGNWKANQEQAIRWYEEALCFLTPKTVPLEYTATQINLGNAYRDLPTGDREANLKQAMACYQETLRFYTRESAPYEYAATLNHLANAYCKLPTGNRGANLAQAITCYQAALRVYTRESAPYDYALIQNNLGNAYHDLPKSYYGANLEKAIACYRDALSVCTLESAPYDYALIQNNLGNAYRDLPIGDRFANLTCAIQYYQQALQVRTWEAAPYDYAATLNSLGNAYHHRYLLTDDSQELERAIERYQKALQVRTREAAPYDYAATLNSLGNAYHDLRTGDREANLSQAIQCYQEALSLLTPEIAPHECRHVAFTAARLGNAAEALLILERGKTRLLAEVWRLRTPRQPNVPDEVWSTFEQAGTTLRAIQNNRVSLFGNEQAYLARQQAAHEANGALHAAIEQVRKYAPDFLKKIDLPTIQALIPDEQTALVAFCISEFGSYAFIVSLVSQKQPEAVQMVQMPNFCEGDLNRLLFAKPDEHQDVSSGWVEDYRRWVKNVRHQDTHSWLSTMERVLIEVGEKLFAPIITALTPEIDQLIFLPSGGLFLLPLHAVPLSDGEERLCDRYQVSYAPSLKMLTNSQQKAARSSGDSLYAVIDPERQLAFTQAEGAAIAELFAEREVHEGKAATKDAVIAGVRGRAYVHFSCAGGYNWNDPSASNLMLADGHLTLADLQSGLLDMSACRLVTLSSGETGIIDVMKGSAEEYISLSAGFMLAGVPCVVSSLWSVPDLSTALLMERFYRNHLTSGMNFAAALREAQLSVRNICVGEVAQYAERCFREFKDIARVKVEWIKHARHYRYRAQQDPDERPFAHPYYWAAFTVNGIEHGFAENTGVR